MRPPLLAALALLAAAARAASVAPAPAFRPVSPAQAAVLQQTILASPGIAAAFPGGLGALGAFDPASESQRALLAPLQLALDASPGLAPAEAVKAAAAAVDFKVRGLIARSRKSDLALADLNGAATDLAELQSLAALYSPPTETAALSKALVAAQARLARRQGETASSFAASEAEKLKPAPVSGTVVSMGEEKVRRLTAGLAAGESADFRAAVAGVRRWMESPASHEEAAQARLAAELEPLYALRGNEGGAGPMLRGLLTDLGKGSPSEKVKLRTIRVLAGAAGTSYFDAVAIKDIALASGARVRREAMETLRGPVGGTLSRRSASDLVLEIERAPLPQAAPAAPPSPL